MSEHCHEPQPEKVEEKLFRAELKTRAVLTEEKPKSVILAAQRFLTVESGSSAEDDKTMKFNLPEELKTVSC